MFSRLRSNYRLSNILVRIAFVLFYVLYSWQNSLAAAKMTARQMAQLGFVALPDVYINVMAFFVAAGIGVGLMFLVPFLAKTFLKASHFYNVPYEEYGLLAHVFFTLYFAVCGALKLINLATPLLLVWGEILFPFVVSLGSVVWFYAVTAKLYFNDVTKPLYFRNVAITYFVLAFLFGVVL